MRPPSRSVSRYTLTRGVHASLVASLVSSLVAALLSAACGDGRIAAPVGTDPVVTVSVDPSSLSLTNAGSSSTLRATATTARGTPVDVAIAWSSDNHAVATVADSAGVAIVTAVAPGRATITASSGSVNGTTSVEVSAGFALASQVSAQAGGTLGNGQNQATSISLAGQVDSWTFAGTQGEALTITMAEQSGTVDFTPWIRLVAPNGAVLVNTSNPTVARTDVSLPQTGTYTVLAASYDAGFNDTGTYRLRMVKAPGNFVVPANDQGGAVTNGENHLGAIAAGDLDPWSFTATQGDAISLTMSELAGVADFTPWIRIVAPNGSVITNISNPTVARSDFNAPQTGTYTVVASSYDPGNDATGDYRLILARVPGSFIVPTGDDGGALANGSNQVGSIATGDLDLWTFSATQGDAVTLTMAELSGVPDFTPWIRLVAPNGSVIVNTSNPSVARADLNLPQTGTYTLVVSSYDPGNDATGAYRLNLARAPGTFAIPVGDDGGPMTNGQNHAGSIDVGDLDMWSITATQGEAITMTLTELTGVPDFTPWIRLIAPNGVVMANTSGATVARIDLNAPQTGSYTVVVSSYDPNNDATGTYRLILARAPGTFTIADDGGPTNNGVNKTGTIDVGDLDMWSFNATQGNAITITMAEVAGTSQFGPWIRVIAPNGAVIVNTSNAAVARADFSAPQTGSYTIVASSYDAGYDDSGTYRLIVAKAPGSFSTSAGDQGGALTNGINQAGAIDVGDLDMWSFSANQGDALTVTMAEVAGVADFTPWIRLVAPSGAVIANTSGAAVARLDLPAPQTGTYVLVVSSYDPNNDATGSYRLVLSKAPGSFSISSGDQGGALANGVGRNGAITVGDVDMWTFNAVQGSTFTVTMTETAGVADFSPWVRLVAPNGAVVANLSNASAVTLNLTAGATGKYTIVASSYDAGFDATGNYTIRVSGVGISSVGTDPTIAMEPLP